MWCLSFAVDQWICGGLLYAIIFYQLGSCCSSHASFSLSCILGLIWLDFVYLALVHPVPPLSRRNVSRQVSCPVRATASLLQWGYCTLQAVSWGTEPRMSMSIYRTGWAELSPTDNTEAITQLFTRHFHESFYKGFLEDPPPCLPFFSPEPRQILGINPSGKTGTLCLW